MTCAHLIIAELFPVQGLENKDTYRTNSIASCSDNSFLKSFSAKGEQRNMEGSLKGLPLVQSGTLEHQNI